MDVPSGALGATVNYEEFIQSVAFSADGDFFAGATAGTVNGEFIPVVNLWDVSDGEPLGSLYGHAGPANLLKFSLEGSFLAAAVGDGSIAVWEIPQPEAVNILSGITGETQDLAFSPDGQHLVAIASEGTGASAKRWELASGEEAGSWNGEAAAVTPNGLVLAIHSGGQLQLIGAASGEALQTLESAPGLAILDFSPEGRLLAGISPEEPAVYLWGVAED
jgi:WD40 repeat protein